MWHFNDGGHFWGMHWMWWSFILLVIILVVLISMIVQNHGNQKETPLDILKKRYAGGEIGKEEYEERKKVLENK